MSDCDRELYVKSFENFVRLAALRDVSTAVSVLLDDALRDFEKKADLYSLGRTQSCRSMLAAIDKLILSVGEVKI